MRNQASAPQANALPSAAEGCPRCKAIKATRYEAVRQGDKHTAAAMAEAMGLHQRAAHS